MPNDLMVIEQQLEPLKPRLQQVLASRVPVERLTRTVLVAVEKTPKLIECTRQSLFNAVMTAAVLALEVDGVTGQAFLIPYYNTRISASEAQLQIGYKGMNTLGARSGYAINAATVREGDAFDYELGSHGYIRHKPKLSNEGRIIAAWSCATSKELMPVFSILPIDEIMAIKAKSQGAKKQDSPWNDPRIGFLAMAEKSARRRLARSMPLNALTRDYHLAARMEEAFEEQGKLSHIREDSTLVVDGEFTPLAPAQPSETPAMADIVGQKPDPERASLTTAGREASAQGDDALSNWWGSLSGRQQKMIAPSVTTFGFLSGNNLAVVREALGAAS